jgi:hypothetical protein
MLKNCFMRLMGVRRRTLILVMALMVPLGLGMVSSALAKEPTGDFAIFKQCPRFTTGVNLCLYARITGGEMTLNKLTVPIADTVTLQFGVIATETGEEKVVGALNGETLSATPQRMPGGLSSLIDCNEIEGRGFSVRARRRICKAVFENPWFTTVNATTELARPASEIILNGANQTSGEGTALSLPVKIHLENPLLGRGCYIGSSTEPIVFNLTTGKTSPPEPNKPISGSLGAIVFKDTFEFVELTEHTEVDNAFTAPEATGCGGPFSSIVDPLINSKIGLPSPAGYNTIIHKGTAEEGTTVGVIGSEKGDKGGVNQAKNGVMGQAQLLGGIGTTAERREAQGRETRCRVGSCQGRGL